YNSSQCLQLILLSFIDYPQQLSTLFPTRRSSDLMNYHFFTGKNHIESEELQKLKKSPIYQRLIADNPHYELYLQTLYDMSNHDRSEEHTSELQSRFDLVCRLLLEKKKI